MAAAETYRRYARDVASFAEALGRFLDVMQPKQANFGGFSTWVSIPGQEADALQRRAAVDGVAGRAAYGLAAAGSLASWKPRGTMQRQTVNVASAWATILDRDPMLDVGTILACCDQAAGILEMKAEEAEEREHQRFRRLLGLAEAVTGAKLQPLARWALRAMEALALGVAGAGIAFWIGWH